MLFDPLQKLCVSYVTQICPNMGSLKFNWLSCPSHQTSCLCIITCCCSAGILEGLCSLDAQEVQNNINDELCGVDKSRTSTFDINFYFGSILTGKTHIAGLSWLIMLEFWGVTKEVWDQKYKMNKYHTQIYPSADFFLTACLVRAPGWAATYTQMWDFERKMMDALEDFSDSLYFTLKTDLCIFYSFFCHGCLTFFKDLSCTTWCKKKRQIGRCKVNTSWDFHLLKSWYLIVEENRDSSDIAEHGPASINTDANRFGKARDSPAVALLKRVVWSTLMSNQSNLNIIMLFYSVIHGDY